MNFRDNSSHKRERPGRHQPPMVFKAECDGEAVSLKGGEWFLLGGTKNYGAPLLSHCWRFEDPGGNILALSFLISGLIFNILTWNCFVIVLF